MDLNVWRTVLIPILLFLGTVGNVLSIITVTNRFCKRSSYTVHLTALAIFDLLTLYTAITKIWVPDAFGIHLISMSPAYCKIHIFIISLVSGVSYWLIVCLAIERTFSLYYPHKAKAVCKPRTALMSIMLLVAFFSCYSSHYILFTQLYSSETCCHDQLHAANGMSTISGLENTTNAVTEHMNNGKDVPQFTTIVKKRRHGRKGTMTDNDCKVIANSADVNRTSTFTDRAMNEACQMFWRSDGSRNESHEEFHRKPSDLGHNLTSSTQQPDTTNSSGFMGIVDYSDETTSTKSQVPSDGQGANMNLEDSLSTKFLCGFVDQGYKEFYRYWVWIDCSVFFCVPVGIIIICNTATWIKVFNSTRGARVNATTQVVRRTRHVLILTTLISLTFILFLSPFTALYFIGSVTIDDITYPVSNEESKKTLEFVAECLYLCIPSCNFFLYILSGQRFRKSLKATFCKRKSMNGRPDIIYGIEARPKPVQKF